MAFAESELQAYQKRLGELRAKRSSWMTHWADLAENILPRRFRLNPKGDYERGDKLNAKIYNATPTLAARALASGMMAAVTSPSRVWFRMAPPDPDMADWGPAKSYLHQVETIVRFLFVRSNFYQSLCDGVYADLGIFGTAADVMEEHATRVIHCRPLVLGEYFLATNGDGEVDTCYEETAMTVRQVVTAFCADGNLVRLSPGVRTAYVQGNYEQVVEVIHAIEPNSDFTEGRIDRFGKRWKSDWFEKGSDGNRFLRRSGYEEFPVLAPRWAARGTEPYGRSPGMDVLPDCKQLQHDEYRRAELIDKLADPPMKGSAGLAGASKSLVPGDVTILPEGANQQIFEPSMTVNPAALAALEQSNARIEDKIDRGFFVDLWLRIISDERQQRATATEVEEGHQETMLQLGPVLERLNPELLKPAVDRVYAMAERRGLLPPPPRELQGKELRVEFISVLHQAQKATGLSAIRTYVQETAFLGQVKPGALDKLNEDAIVDEMADILGVKPELVLSSDEVAAIRAHRAAHQQALEQGQALAQGVQGAATLAKAPAAAPDNALGQVLSSLGPIAAGATPPGKGALAAANPQYLTGGGA